MSFLTLSCSERTDVDNSLVADEYTFTDSLVFEEHGLMLKFDSNDLFDTTYQYMYQSCVYSTFGYHILDTTYEEVIPWSSNWQPIKVDSMMSLRIHCNKTSELGNADLFELKQMYEKNKTINKIVGKSYTPTFGTSEKINQLDYAFLGEKDTILRDSTKLFNTSLHARTYIDSSIISFQFERISQKTDPIELQFLELLRSVKIEEIP